MKNSLIEWTDHTFNPWEGCTKVSPGCAHCYAEARNQRFSKGANWGKGAPRRRTSASNWNEPRKWNKEAHLFVQCTAGHRWQAKSVDQEGFCPVCGDPESNAVRPRVFCASLADWLDDEVPIEWLADLLVLIRETPNLDWQLLTKRPQNWSVRIRMARNYLTLRDAETALWLNDWLPKHASAGMPARDGKPPVNVWIGTTVEDQQRANERVPCLFAIPAKIRFLSCEPLLEAVDLRKAGALWSDMNNQPFDGIGLTQFLHLVIVGGESGLGARPMNPVWARDLRDDCKAAAVPFFFKQWGEWWPLLEGLPDNSELQEVTVAGKKLKAVQFGNEALVRVGKKEAGRLLDGKEHSEFPAVAGTD